MDNINPEISSEIWNKIETLALRVEKLERQLEEIRELYHVEKQDIGSLNVSDEPIDLSLPSEERIVESVSEPDRHEADKEAIMDVMEEHMAWKKDIPGSMVHSLRSAIALGDRVLFIRKLFKDDALLYRDTVEKLNNMQSLDEAIDYIKENFGDWNMESEDVYRFMMAVRRKLR